MNELHLQDKFLLPFFRDTLGYQEVRANTVSSSLIIEEDLERFISDTEMNRKPYETLLRKYSGDGKQLLADLIALIQERAASSRNMALFINSNKSVTLNGEKLYLFYTSDSAIYDNALFDQNIFSVVQELPYKYTYEGRQIFSFRPDLCFFVNGLYLGYSELKSNYMSQNASRNGRGKVIKDYFDAVRVYHQVVDRDPNLSDREKESYRRDFLKIFEKAIHLTTTDIGETYVIRTISDFFPEILETCRAEKFDRESFEKEAQKVFKPYPLLNRDAEKKDKLKEIFAAHYGKEFIEKEILYYNFIERDVVVKGDTKELKNEPGVLISPRPKQKFGTDKILAKIDEFLAHENEDDYFEKMLERQLASVSETKKKELLEKRRAYSNNKNIYSLLLQYAAGFGKSNIIGWTALQLKDLRRPYNGNFEYVYDKIFIIVDRLQLRSQIDTKMRNMNIDKSMFMEARNKKTFLEALNSDLRLVIVNLQKFGSIREMFDGETLQALTQKRVVFLIDEIHRSHSGDQNEEMVSIFDELQTPFDQNAAYQSARRKKNLIVGFTATPDDNSLARFGEFSKYAENEKLWVPFDAYTMREAIEDGYILNPIKNIVPIASKMLFDLPQNPLEGFEKQELKDINKKDIYENRDRIDAIAKYVADLLVKDVYRQIRGTGKAMLAVYSIKAAIAYKEAVTKHYKKLVKQDKYKRYADAPIYVIFTGGQDEQDASNLNEGMSEEKVLQEFTKKRNGLMIVVAKLQTGYDEKRLHTLFLDKEVREIGAIQAISRVNRTTKHKHDCKIVDFSYNNVNIQNIKDAFEHFSDVVVSDFDPFGDKRILEEVLYSDLKKSDVYEKFFERFSDIFKDKDKRDNPESYLAFESSLEKHISANPKRTADTKAKSAQYFSILNRIEYVIEIDKKYSEKSFLYFWRKFNALYNTLNRSEETKDPIEVYFDNQIGIIEVKTEPTPEKKKKETKVAQAPGEYTTGYKFDILKVIEARNAQEAIVGKLIEEFAEKIEDLFEYVRNSTEGKRLIIKIKSHVSEDEIYDDFAKIYRRYRALNRARVGDYFFKETEDLVNKLCDDFELTVRITDTDFFNNLTATAKTLRQRGPEEISFTAYHPKEGNIDLWHTLLVYTHLTSALSKIQEDVKRFADQIKSPKETTTIASTPIMRGMELTIIPSCEGITFNPERVSFKWMEDFHRADFRLKADQSLSDDAAKGSIDIYVGPLIIGTLKFAMLFNEKEAQPVPDHEESAKMYGKDDVFISYSRKDSEIARTFKTVLEGTGLDVFLDVDDIRSGQLWDDELKRRIERAKIFQVFWSANYSQSENCKQEWEYALKQNKDEGYIRPVFWQKPLSPNPPEELNKFNFKYVELKSSNG